MPLFCKVAPLLCGGKGQPDISIVTHKTITVLWYFGSLRLAPPTHHLHLPSPNQAMYEDAIAAPAADSADSRKHLVLLQLQVRLLTLHGHGYCYPP